MGFPCVWLKIPMRFLRSKLLQETVILLERMLVAAISHLGLLLKRPEQPPSPPSDDQEEDTAAAANGYVLLTDGTCPIPVPVPIPILTTLIKKKLSVITLQSFLNKMGEGYQIQKDDEDRIRCSVCLEELEMSDEIRELWNCCHVFHRKCLECWVDQGQISCPLCRSMLFQESTCVGDARFLLRDFNVNAVGADQTQLTD